MLAKVAALPIATWNWKSQDAAIRHMGPMAQDFAAAFGLGETPRGINTVDSEGVALAAIKGLNAKVEEQQREIAELTERVQKAENPGRRCGGAEGGAGGVAARAGNRRGQVDAPAWFPRHLTQTTANDPTAAVELC